MEDDIIGNLVIDPDLDSYDNFFDYEWSKRIFTLVDNSSMEEAVSSLMIAWRATNGTHRLPWLMVRSLRSNVEGAYDGHLRCRADYSGDVIRSLVEKIESRMQFDLSFDQRRKLERAVRKIEEEAFEALKSAQSRVEEDVEAYWDFVIHSSEFQFSIAGQQRSIYCSLFFAYEDFLANVIRTKEPQYSSKNDPIKKAFLRCFDASLTDYCWNHDDVVFPQLVRHALAHNGGRIGVDLQPYKARFVDATGTSQPLLQGDLLILVEGEIQITPCHTRHLFSMLKERVTKIVEELA